MKKFLYLCVMMTLSLSLMAQIDPCDRNWDTIVLDDFNNNAWNTWYNWQITHPSGRYYTFIPDWPSGVSRGESEHQVYQRENCLFNNTCTLRFVTIYEGGPDNTPLLCGDYDIPPGKTCDTSHHTLYYTSGKIETTDQFFYGYFEISCSLPIHKGSFPAFWLFGGGSSYYNEIDIFEYSWGISHLDHFKQFTCGIYCNNNQNIPISKARVTPILDNSSTNLTNPHVFACEWLPEKVTWYVDGEIVNEFTDYEYIPHHPMSLKVNYAIDNYAVPYQTGQPQWFDGDEMIIDYVKVLQLKTSCDTDVLISTLQEFEDYEPSVKKTIAIEPAIEFTIPTNTNVYMRAVDSIVIGKGITIPFGAQMTLQTQLCPN
jgi:hypothetical protein